MEKAPSNSSLEREESGISTSVGWERNTVWMKSQ